MKEVDVAGLEPGDADQHSPGSVEAARDELDETAAIPGIAAGGDPLGVPDQLRVGAGEARRRGEIALILLGDPNLYPRFGFEPASRYGLRNPFAGVNAGGFTIAEEDLQIRPLTEDLGSLPGQVTWHPAFG
jgi:hypothetical protein